MYINVILPLALPQLFTYSVPSELKNEIVQGIRVAVQVGQKKKYSAIVYRIYEQNKTLPYTIKPILSVLDTHPIINNIQLKLWEWIASYYMCSLGEVMKAALPAGFKMESETRVSLKKQIEFNDIELNSTESQIVNILKKRDLSINMLSFEIKRKNILPIIKELLDKGIINIHENLKNTYQPKTITFVRLHPKINNEKELINTLDSLKRANKQRAILEEYIQLASPLNYKTPTEISKKELLIKSRSNHAVLKACVEKEILQYFEKEVNRINNTASINKQIAKLTQSQQVALDSINQQFKKFDTLLLHGITSSGKTEIYIKLIDEQLRLNKQVLYLLPEIALTTQIIERLKNVFGNKVGIYHSHFSDNERVEIYNNLLLNNKNKGFVVLGVRSSIFLPYTNLGLIIVDEEHENTYKQYDPAPRYNARDAAIVLSQFHKAKTLLGTATPAIETYFNAINNKYGFVELSERYKNIEPPKFEIVDMLRARKRKEITNHFSKILLNEIEQALNQEEQIILFQNRRGFSPYVICQTCGYTPRCKYCDVSLTYHKANNQLVCHYCGYTIQMQYHCPQCKSADIHTCGFGTEKIEEELKLLFPDARIERLDLDSTRQKNAYGRILKKFEEGETNILVGTQMLSKGLDFDNVSLVGILNADNMLNFPDFRAYERSFQLMCQVGGRAGRKNKQGKVIVQTSDPKNPIIHYIKTNDYTSMYNMQIEERTAFNYPPFSRLITITLKHTDKAIVNEAVISLNRMLKPIFGNRLAGPETPLINRIQNKYLLNFRLKLEKGKTAQKTKLLLRECLYQLIQSKKDYRNIQISLDIDPM